MSSTLLDCVSKREKGEGCIEKDVKNFVYNINQKRLLDGNNFEWKIKGILF